VVDFEAEFSDWYAANSRRVSASVLGALLDSDIAEECTAEAFARAWLHWHKVRKMESPVGWVFIVAVNHARTLYRRKSRAEQVAVKLQPLSDVTEAEDYNEDLWHAVASLSPQARKAVALRYIADLSESEVAQALGVTRGTVAQTLHRARTQLAKVLNSDSVKEL
jgi:RNA polymerase sigma-70 factor (ECF subfamily)